MAKTNEPASRAGSTRRNTMVMQQVDKQVSKGLAKPMVDKSNMDKATKMGGGGKK